MDSLIRDILDALRAARAECGLDKPLSNTQLSPDAQATPNSQLSSTHQSLSNTQSAADTQPLTEKELERIIRQHNKNLSRNEDHFAKKNLFPYYLYVKNNESEIWDSWNVDADLDAQITRLLQVKPRRTASGVATITVMTKPWKCSSDCLYCPNDLRMPKSYLSDEPVCQRAERNFFDPYLQVASRLRALTRMGHITDKVELIVLGGTWSDYPKAYQIWFVKELFRALNEARITDAGLLQKKLDASAHEKHAFYTQAGLSNEKEGAQAFVQSAQEAVTQGQLTYNQAWDLLYTDNPAWKAAAANQTATLAELEHEQRVNEQADRRVVGLVIETRPDTLSVDSLILLRRLGCTKIQIGVQSVNPEILRENKRSISVNTIQKAFALLRLFGFKIHAHFMVNLFAATPETDKQDYAEFTTNPAYLPDEVKLYPCVLVAGTRLCSCFQQGTWQPYTQEQLLDVLAFDTVHTPAYTRISRMIRDISAHDIMAGNKKANLRQLVENQLAEQQAPIDEIRFREIATAPADKDELTLEVLEYQTTVSTEYFLQWVTKTKSIAGFLRLSLPDQNVVKQYLNDYQFPVCEAQAAHADALSLSHDGCFLTCEDTRSGAPSSSHDNRFPIHEGEAMIREVHVYGVVAGLHKTGKGAQHLGLGKRLIERAAEIAHEHGYARLNVISSIGTREYYRKQGFKDNGLYQQLEL